MKYKCLLKKNHIKVFFASEDSTTVDYRIAQKAHKMEINLCKTIDWLSKQVEIYHILNVKFNILANCFNWGNYRKRSITNAVYETF